MLHNAGCVPSEKQIEALLRNRQNGTCSNAAQPQHFVILGASLPEGTVHCRKAFVVVGVHINTNAPGYHQVSIARERRDMLPNVAAGQPGVWQHFMGFASAPTTAEVLDMHARG